MSQDRNFDFIEYFGPILIPVALVFALWFMGKETITQFMLRISPPVFELAALYVPSPIIPDGKRAKLARLAIQLPEQNHVAISKTNPWKATWSLMTLWGYIARPILIPILLVFAVVWWRNVPSRVKYRHELKLMELAKLNAEAFPCLWPSIRAEVFKRDPFVGTWKMPLTLIEWVMANGLLVYKKGQKNELPIPPQGLNFIKKTVPQRRKMHATEFIGLQKIVDEKNSTLQPHERIDISGLNNFLSSYTYFSIDEAKCDLAFKNQLGKPWKGINALPSLERALCICFMGIICGGKVKKTAVAMMDQISRTFIQAEEDKDYKIIGVSKADLSGIEELKSSVERHGEYRHIKTMINSHYYESTVMMRLLSRSHGGARKKGGKISALNFHWLKPHNEQLYRVLHKVDAQRPWTEGLAAFVQFENEIRLGQAIATPVIEGATASVIANLHNEEWMKDAELARMAEDERRAVLDMLAKADEADKQSPTGQKPRRS